MNILRIDAQIDTMISNRLEIHLARIKRCGACANENDLAALVQLIKSILQVINNLDKKDVPSYAVPSIVSKAKIELDARMDLGGSADQMIDEFFNNVQAKTGIINANPLSMYHKPEATFKRFCGKYSITKRLIHGLFAFCAERNIPIKLKYEFFSGNKYYFNYLFVECNNLLHELCEIYSLEYRRELKEATVQDLIKREYLIFKDAPAIIKARAAFINTEQSLA